MSEHAELFAVVVNEEQQFALLAAGVARPPGWYEAGFSGTEHQCTSWVDRRQGIQVRSTRSAPNIGP